MNLLFLHLAAPLSAGAADEFRLLLVLRGAERRGAQLFTQRTAGLGVLRGGGVET